MRLARDRSEGNIPAIDIDVASPLWTSRPDAHAVIRRAIEAAAAAAGALVPVHAEVAVVLNDDVGVRALNKRWRNQDQATNVLSFPASRPSDVQPRLLGDIVIAYETTVREADQEKKPFDHHLAHLAVHGFLHLLGYDHESDDEAEAMEGLERAILKRLNVPDPYRPAQTDA